MRVGKHINAKYPHEMRWFIAMLAWRLPLRTYNQTDDVHPHSRALRMLVADVVIHRSRTYASRSML